jgi:acetolactate synthase small subunit
MKKDYTLEIQADNNFSILNRIINTLNRRRIRIRQMSARETEEDFRRGIALFVLHTTPDLMEKTKHQLEKLIEVESAVYTEGNERYLEFTEVYGNKLERIQNG